MNFKHTTPVEVQAQLLNYRASGKAVRIFYGDTDNGRDWLEEHDVIGYVGVSTGTVKAPLLCPMRTVYGSAILDHCIVRMLDGETGREVYRHPKYNQPNFRIVAVASGFEVQDEYHQTFIFSASKHGATRWKRFITGEKVYK